MQGSWIGSLVGRRFWLAGYLALAAGFLVPGNWLPQEIMAHCVPFLLGGILFFSGLRLPLTEIIGSVRDLSLFRQQALVLPWKLLLIPLAAYAVTLFIFPQWAPGVLLVSLMPMGLSSIALNDLYGGHRMMAVFLVVGSSVIAPISIPLILAVLGYIGEDGFPIVPLLQRTGYILLLLGVPLIASQIVRRMAAQVVERFHHSWNGWAICCTSLLVFTAVSATRPWWESLSVLDLTLATLAACLGACVGFIGALIPMRFLPRERSLAVIMGVLYMNNGLAVAFALQFFPGHVGFLLPSVLMQIPMITATAIAGKCFVIQSESPS